MGWNHFSAKTEKKKFLYYDELDPNKTTAQVAPTISENSVSYLSLSPQTSKFSEVRFEPPLQRHTSTKPQTPPLFSSPSLRQSSRLHLLLSLSLSVVEFCLWWWSRVQGERRRHTLEAKVWEGEALRRALSGTRRKDRKRRRYLSSDWYHTN